MSIQLLNQSQVHPQVGKSKIAKNGLKMTIVGYRNFSDVDVQFEDGFLAEGVELCQYNRGNITNPYVPSVYTFGFMGEGGYKGSNNGKHTPQYIAWKSMLNRCYSSTYHKRQPTYIGCTVTEEWHNFQNFAKWHDENCYEIANNKMALDKDILVRGNKMYSPATCAYVPESINKLVSKKESCRGELPIGVNHSKDRKKYESWCSTGVKQGYLGCYSTKEEAFLVYKVAKENFIKATANSYKGIIPTRLYDALVNYEVGYND